MFEFGNELGSVKIFSFFTNLLFVIANPIILKNSFLNRLMLKVINFDRIQVTICLAYFLNYTIN